jgi:hypothetical protein
MAKDIRLCLYRKNRKQNRFLNGLIDRLPGKLEGANFPVSRRNRDLRSVWSPRVSDKLALSWEIHAAHEILEARIRAQTVHSEVSPQEVRKVRGPFLVRFF